MKIIKKIITDRLPSVFLIRELASLYGISGSFHPLFLDIETTGLAKKTTQIYLIGAIVYEEDNWILTQWFAEDSEEEASILQSFFSFAENYTYLVHYNGNRFDLPYLKERGRLHSLPAVLDKIPSIDLYHFLKRFQSLLQLDHMRQSDMEKLLDRPERNYPDGKACIAHYKTFLQTQDPAASALCFGHNEEDLCGLGNIFPVLSYSGLISKRWEYDSLQLYQQELTFLLKLEFPVPFPISGGIPGMYVRIDQTCIRLLVKIRNGRLQQFYSNYKDYDYLIQEDTVIPKALGTYIDKSLKTNATPENCYTWFPCTEEFLHNRQKQLQYLDNALPHLLGILNS